MICQKCGSENKKSGKFCSCCGARLEAVQDIQKTACGACNWPNQVTAKFCGKCGHDLREVALAAVEEAISTADMGSGRAIPAHRDPVPIGDSGPFERPLPVAEKPVDIVIPTTSPPAAESDVRAEVPTKPGKHADTMSLHPAEEQEPLTPQAAIVAPPTCLETESAAGQQSSPPAKRAWIAVVALLIGLALAVGAWWYLKPPAVQPAMAGSGSASMTVPPEAPAASASQVQVANPAPAPAQDPAPAADTVANEKPQPPAVVEPSAPTAAEKEAEQKRIMAERAAKRRAAEEQKRKAAEEAKAKIQKEVLPVQRPPEKAPEHVEHIPAPQKVVSTQEKIAQCQSLNFFKRELCMLQVCNNKWGRDGCPAYQSNQSQNQ